MRLHNNRWQITSRLHDAWRPAATHDIPRKLRNPKHHNRNKQHRDDSYDDHDEAPRHGHRRRHQGHELSYDSNVGAYAIIKRPGIYLHNGRYLRRHKGVWQSSKKLNGGWHAAKERHVPRKLKSAKHPKKQLKKKHDQKEWRKH